MTNHYQPTRADQLQPGDVVRDPFSKTCGEIVLTEIRTITKRGRTWYVIDHVMYLARAKFDKRLTDEEYEALRAPGGER